MRDYMMKRYDRRYTPRLMCRPLAYHREAIAAAKRARAASNRALLTYTQHLHRKCRQTYGSPRICGALHAQGQRVGDHPVARLMRHHGLGIKTVSK